MGASAKLRAMVTGAVTLCAGAAWAASASAAAPDSPHSHSARVMLSVDDVAGAISARGVGVVARQISMLSWVVAVREHPRLAIKSFERWDNLRTKVELTCGTGGQCLPFYVLVNWPDKRSADEALENFRPEELRPVESRPGESKPGESRPGESRPGELKVWESRVGEFRPLEGKRKEGDVQILTGSERHAANMPRLARSSASFPEDELSLGGRDGGRTSPVIVMKAGARATLLIDAKQLHIRVSVISLENGSVGHKIRVRSQDFKQIYVAEVIDSRSLKGTLE